VQTVRSVQESLLLGESQVELVNLETIRPFSYELCGFLDLSEGLRVVLCVSDEATKTRVMSINGFLPFRRVPRDVYVPLDLFLGRLPWSIENYGCDRGLGQLALGTLESELKLVLEAKKTDVLEPVPNELTAYLYCGEICLQSDPEPFKEWSDLFRPTRKRRR
jgi:hypothetical protein